MICDIKNPLDKIKVNGYNDIPVFYEDNHIIVVLKPAGILSQEDITGDLDILTILKAYLKQKYHKEGNVYLGLLHRLDRPVHGLMVFAKTSKAASRISEQIRNHKFIKKYRLVCHSLFEKGEKSGIMQNYILKDKRNNSSKVVNSNVKDAKLSKLVYNVIAENVKENCSLVEVDLITGRSHQIRVQFKYNGHELVNDFRYSEVGGKNENNGKPKANRKNKNADICLESYYLEFSHPVSKEKMVFVFSGCDEWPWNLFGGED